MKTIDAVKILESIIQTYPTLFTPEGKPKTSEINLAVVNLCVDIDTLLKGNPEDLILVLRTAKLLAKLEGSLS